MTQSEHQRVKDFYQVPALDVVEQLDSSELGLNESEATVRLKKFGSNTLLKIRQEPIIFKFLHQFKDFMIILLIISALISFYLGDTKTLIILLSIVLINAVIGFLQEYKAERIMKSLQALEVEQAKVYRDKQLKTINASDLVIGDIVLIEEGDSIPADGRILKEFELATNDFALTGESNPSRKFTHAIHGNVLIGSRSNLVFMGTTVATGNAHIIITATGMNTELGRIASLSQTTKSGPSPLQREMAHLASRITLATILLAIILIAISFGANLSLKEAFIFAIGIAAAMIPQGLPAELNTSLAQAANQLSKSKALVKKLSAVETLGATSIICTDKTGTLTKNEMTVEQITFLTDSFSVSGKGYEPSGVFYDSEMNPLISDRLSNLHKFFATGFFASNAYIEKPDEKHHQYYCIGDPTEGALVTLAQKAGLKTDALESSSPELKEFPFDSARKRMSSVRLYNKKLTAFVKGAPESILERCSHIEVDGKIRVITKGDKALIKAQNDMFARKALRNLAFAYRFLPASLDYKVHNPDVIENNLIYMGMVSMIDPVREDVAEAMHAARKAHISVSIITGDYAPTAKAIAVRARLADHPDDITVISGEELPNINDKKILELISRGGIIFSRVSPEDKLRIVNIIRSAKKIVAVTGDGINDAPALKRADIGVAMGLSGTDVAKQSAEIVLLDDSFHTLVVAIQQGRGVFNNIKKATISCLTSNFGELVLVLIGLAAASLLGIPPAITAVQILAIDLIAELFPIAALGWDSPEKSLMEDSPRDINSHIFNKKVALDLLFSGLVIGIVSYVNFILFAERSGTTFDSISHNSAIYASATTVAYATMVACQLLNILSRRSEQPTISKYLFTNSKLWLAMGLSIFCVLNIVYNPLIQPIFGSNYLKPVDWLFVILAALLFFVYREITKIFAKKPHPLH